MRRSGLAAFLIALLSACSGTTTTRQRPVPATPTPTGEAVKPASAIIGDARAALQAATSVRLTGTFAAPSGPSTQHLDLRLTRVRGMPAATGTVTTVTGSGAKASTVTLDLIRLGSRLYIRGDRAYYARIGPKAVAVAGHWIALPAAQDRSVAALTDLSGLAAGLSATPADRTLGTERLGGAAVLAVTAGPGATLYVAATGPARPVRLQRSAGTAAGVGGTLDFSDYGAPLAVAAPAGAIDIATLRG